jgi:phosphatidate cytidylyltransferase
MNYDGITFSLVGVALALLSLATGAGQLLRRQNHYGLDTGALEQFNLRVRAWWLLCAVLAAAFLLGQTATVVLFGLVSFWALREFITLTPTRLADHRALFWVFFLFTPLQYVLVGLDNYALYSILIPVYAFLFIPARVALAGDFKRYLERCAKIQAGLMICVYCLSFAPAVLTLKLDRYEPTYAGQNARLLFFFVLVVVMGDAFRLASEWLMGRHIIAPAINPGRTWEGLLGGLGCSVIFGTSLTWATPYEVWQTALVSLVVTSMGFAGGMTMSAIKRDRGVKDYGTLVQGHGGVLDRIDSICFAAPVFYHLTRWIFPPG